MNSNNTENLLDEYKQILGLQIKLDVARAIRDHSDPEERDLDPAYDKLASSDTIQSMVKELAVEEVVDTIARGEVPPAALLALAGLAPDFATGG